MVFNPQHGIGDRKWTWEEDGYTVIRSNARTAPGCHENCGILLYVKDGKLVKVEGDPENPYNQGRLCPRCLCLNEMLYHPNRITYPMKRAVEDRGKDKWVRITWDEAYEIVDKKYHEIIAKYGPESIYVAKGTGRDTSGYTYRIANSMGSPNSITYLSGVACYNPRIFGTSMKFGDMVLADFSQFFEDRFDNPNYELPEYCLVWGCNPVIANSDGTLGHWVTDIAKLGTKLIVVDPKAIWLAGRSEYYLPIRPGTDGCLANGICKIIVDEDLYDHDFVEKWCHGFEEFKEHIKNYPVEEVARICGLDKELILETARAIGKGKSFCMQWGVAISQCTEGCVAGMALMDLMALTGNIEKPGSNVVGRSCFGVAHTWRWNVYGGKVLTPEQEAKRMNKPYPCMQYLGCPSPDMLTTALNTGEPYPIKSVWMHSSNPIAGSPADSKRVLSGLQKTEFNVVVDLFMTPSAMAVADLFLPCSCYPERNGLTGHNPYYLGAIVKAIEPQGEARSDQSIIVQVGSLFNKEWNPWEDDMALYSQMLKDIGTDFEEVRAHTWSYPPFEYYKHEKGKLRADGRPGFNTPSGKYEFYSETLELFGEEPVAVYSEPPESPLSRPDLAKDYPLILTTGARRIGLFHSEHRQSPSMRHLHPDPLVTIHPKTAEKYSIKDGDWVIVENHRDKVKLRAEITEGIREDTVSADHAWWFPEREPEDGTFFGAFDSNINCLIPSEPGHCGFGAPYKSLLCKIYKYSEGSEQ